MLNLVTGGAGFLGSHLVNALIDAGDRVIIIDNLSTGHVRNLEHALSSGRATFVYADVAVPYARLSDIVANAGKAKIDRIYHFASPASPEAYGSDPWGTLAVNGIGTMSLIEMALKHGARFLFASTSEIYGDPLVHPQPESYFGNVDPIGPRSCYDEGKRFGEAAVAAAVRARGLDGRVVRFFNCYGPGMAEADGRLIPALIEAANENRPFPIHGTGRQTRSMTYVSDAVALARLVMEHRSTTLTPVNVGNDDERSVEEIARALAAVAGIEFQAVYLPAREQDPQRRRPDLTRAKSLGWSPSTSLEEGLFATYRWFRETRLAFA
ncbi:MAG TPA: NAD-dependent epimerase/dehydratase family protein [Candidatus Acidoferrales bacterium]|nr:NAD-dependent epimerase/dehydratase family protein [Candidatus Acidoferrales bacterium]